MKKARHTSVCLALSLMTAVLAFAVSGNPAAHLDTLSDEKVDGQIANSLRQDPFFGNGELTAPARSRLPMYLDALMSASLEGAKGVPSRNVSRIVAVITIVATAGLACSLFGFGTGWLSAIILAISPYFLAYSGLAGTEGDVFAACFVTLALWAYVSYLQSPTPAKWLLAGCMLACAIGATIFAVYLLLVFWLLSATTYSEPTFKLSRMPNHTARLHRLLRWQLGVIIVTFALAVLHRFPPGRMQLDRVLPIARMAAIFGWVALAALWTATVSYVVVVGVLSRSREERFWGMAAFAFCTVFVLMPVHLLDPSIAREMLIKVGSWDGGFPFGSIVSHVRLYSGIFLLKMTIPLGIVAIISIVYGVFNERNDGRWRSVIWAILLFLLLLCSLPNRRSQNLMAIYPLIAIVTAAGLAGITRRVRDLRSGPITTLWLLVAAGSVAYLGFESWRAHPNYQQFGADILASRFDWKWLGAESRGNRNLIQTSADGVESLLEWCEMSDRVKPGSRVVSYLWDEAIVNDMLPEETRLTFVPRGVSTETGDILSPPAIHNADFILLHLNNFVGYDDRSPDLPPLDELNANFEPVFTVKRGDMELAWVYRRKP